MDERANKGAVVAGLLGMGIALGLLIGAFTFGDSAPKTAPAAGTAAGDPAEHRIQELEAEARALRKAKTAAEAALAEARAPGGAAAAAPASPAASESAQHLATLEAELATAKKEMGKLQAALAEHEPPPGKKLPVAFGTWGELDVLRDADWPKMARASQSIRRKVPQVLDPAVDAKKKFALRIEMAKENQKLAKLALAANGKLPTHSSGNGEYTHPMVLSNVIAAELEGQACRSPRSRWQRSRAWARRTRPAGGSRSRATRRRRPW